MPKKVFKISNLHKGIVGNASKRDIPENSMTYGENVDSRVTGVVRGIQDKESVNASYDARVMTPVLGETNELIGQDSSKQFKSYDIDGDSVSNIGSVTSNFARTMVANNKAAYCGMSTSFRGGTPTTPKWVGTVDNPPFSVASAGDQIVDDAECRSFADSQNYDVDTSPLITLGNMPGSSESAIFGGSSGAFESGKRYFWAVSLVYDEFQESPLIFGEDNGDLWFQDASSAQGYADIMLRLAWDSGDFPERITGVKIYRAQAPEQGTGPTSEYRLIKYIDDLSVGSSNEYNDVGVTLAEDVDTSETDIDVSDGSIFADGDTIKIGDETKSVNSVSGNTLTISSPFSSAHSTSDPVLLNFNKWSVGGDVGFPGTNNFDSHFFFRYRDDGSSGATYEDNTGVPETLESTGVDYALAADYGAYLFVGNCAKDGIGDAEKYIFRSKPKTPSIFDWSTDFVKLPEKPTALAGFGGRLYAFGKFNTYRINPDFMQVEDTYRGVGAINENMVVTTNYGMFHADKNNIYINDGRTSKPIGTPILENQWEDIGWQNIAHTSSADEAYASMEFDPINGRVLCFASTSGDDLIVWAYDIKHQRWDYYKTLGLVSATAVVPNGTLYATIGDTSAGFDLYSLFSSSTRKQWVVRTKDFDFNSDSGFVYLYDLSAYGDGNLDIGYYTNGGETDANPSVSTVGNFRQATVKSSDKKSRSIVIEVSSAATTDTLDNITVQYRLPIIQE